VENVIIGAVIVEPFCPLYWRSQDAAVVRAAVSDTCAACLLRHPLDHCQIDYIMSNKMFFVLYLTFMGPCIADIFSSITNKMQRYTILFISVKCSTCFRRYLRPSSGAQNCIYSIGTCQNFTAACRYRGRVRTSSNSSTIAAGSSKCLTSTRCGIYSFELLKMGGGTVPPETCKHFSLRNVASCWLYLEIVLYV
jgi:hypothetical protein